jgi:hypothetical protein
MPTEWKSEDRLINVRIANDGKCNYLVLLQQYHVDVGIRPWLQSMELPCPARKYLSLMLLYHACIGRIG